MKDSVKTRERKASAHLFYQVMTAKISSHFFKDSFLVCISGANDSVRLVFKSKSTVCGVDYLQVCDFLST